MPLVLYAQQQETVELKFEPLGAQGPGPQELFSMLTGAASPQDSPMIGAPVGPQPTDLGRLFNSLLDIASVPRKQRQHRSSENLGAGSLVDGVDTGGPEVWLEPMSLTNPFSVPTTVFSDLFPVQVAPPDATDMMVTNMMQHISHMFRDTLMPTIRSLQKTEHACAVEVHSMCNATQNKAKSHLHCLGQHSQNISDKCRVRVGKSVPFLCHQAIDQWCDGLDRGILPCLADKLEELQGSCRDSVIATHGVIAKVNTQKASLLNPLTGETLVYMPTSASTAPKTANDKKAETTAMPVLQAVQQEVKLDKVLATPAPWLQSAAAELPVPMQVDQRRGVLVKAPAAGASKQQTAFKDPQDGKHGWGSYLRGLIVVVLVGGFIYALKGNNSAGAKPRCLTKNGALLELNSHTADHIL